MHCGSSIMSSEGSEDDSAVDSEEDQEDDSSDEEEVQAPKLELPSRATRGRRMNKVEPLLWIQQAHSDLSCQGKATKYQFFYREQLLEEEDSADEDFWNQHFFQEEKADEDYASESSEATTADEDFSESVGCYVELPGFLH